MAGDGRPSWSRRAVAWKSLWRHSAGHSTSGSNHGPSRRASGAPTRKATRLAALASAAWAMSGRREPPSIWPSAWLASTRERPNLRDSARSSERPTPGQVWNSSKYSRAGRRRPRSRPARLYFDEFQTCPGVGLSELLAESRKFGLSLVLANQALGQIDGGSRRPDIAQAALANAANLVAFRVGAPDARRLGPWFEPEVEWPALCRQSDFHATARLLQDGRPSPAMTLRAPPPV